jgi:hypothetical protein
MLGDPELEIQIQQGGVVDVVRPRLTAVSNNNKVYLASLFHERR